MNGGNSEAVILMGHGSRVPEAGQGMEAVARILKETGFCGIVEVCYMERQGPRFDEALAKCVAGGAKRVVLIPYFLHRGLHTRVDIPNMMRHEAEKYSNITLIFGKNLGYDDLLLQLVKKRIGESRQLPDVRKIEPQEREKYPLPPEAPVFVTMSQEEAAEYKEKHGDCGHHHHGHHEH